MLDGDDILPSNHISSSLEELLSAQENDGCVSHTYSDHQLLGATGKGIVTPATDIKIRWALQNLSPPNALYDLRKIKDRGLQWDPKMRSGMEDWDFWCSLKDAGLRGVKNEQSYVLYRKMAGNRSSLNRKNDDLNKEIIRKKYKNVSGLNAYLTEESIRFPTWALYTGSKSLWHFTSDLVQRTGTSAEKLNEAIQYQISQENFPAILDTPYAPNLIGFIEEATIRWLQEMKLHHSVMYDLERIIEDHGFCTLDIAESAGSEQCTFVARKSILDKEGIPSRLKTNGIFLSRDWLDISNKDEFGASIAEKILRKLGDVSPFKSLTLTGTFTPPGSSLQNSVNLTREVPLNLYADVSTPAPSRLMTGGSVQGGHRFASHQNICKELFGAWPILRARNQEEKKSAALVVPGKLSQSDWVKIKTICTDKIMNQYKVHMICLGDINFSQPSQPSGLETINFLHLGTSDRIPPDASGYIGTPRYEWASERDLNNLWGHILPFDMVINFVGPIISGVCEKAASFGTEFWLYYSAESKLSGVDELYLSEQRECLADPMTVLAYDGFYSRILTPSNEDQILLSAFGISESKVTTMSQIGSNRA